MSQSIQADNVLYLLGGEGLRFDLGPVAIISDVLSVIGFAIFFPLFLFFIVLFLLLILLFFQLSTPQSAGDPVIVRLLKEAGVVLEANSHVRAEARHFEIMNTRLTHDLLNQDMFKIFSRNGVTFIVELVLEHVKGKAAPLRKSLVNEELLTGIGMRKVDDFFSLSVDVRLVVVVLFDWLLTRNQLANVHSRGV